MIACLKEVDALSAYPIHQPVFLGDSSRPASCQHVFERLGPADAGKRIAKHGFDKPRGQRYGSILAAQETEVLGPPRVKAVAVHVGLQKLVGLSLEHKVLY